jgi:alpha,alpha-trehalase
MNQHATNEGAEREASHALPMAWDCVDRLRSELSHKKIVVFLDYDGTLTPIVSRPELATLSDDMRGVLKRLAGLCTVAIVSGRERGDVERLVGLDNLVYAGSHGFDIAGPGGLQLQHEEGRKALPQLDEAERALRQRLDEVAGSLVERKAFSLAIHYRNVAEEDVASIEQAVNDVESRHSRLRKTSGKAVFELRPDVDWDKGWAIEWLMESLERERSSLLPIYLGDDTTDEDAFRVLRERGVGVLVSESDRPTLARYRLGDPNDVQCFLERLITILQQEQGGDGWKLVYTTWSPSQEPLREALCTLGNGAFATRGAAEESCDSTCHYPGTYVSGGYDRIETEIASRVIENEDLVNWPNWLCLSFRPEGGDWFELDAVKVLDFRQELDLKSGVLSRQMRFQDGEHRETSLRTRRFVHMGDEHKAAIEWTLTPENWEGAIEVRSALDGTVANNGVQRYRDLNGNHLTFVESGLEGEDGIYLVVQTKQSHIQMAQAAQTRAFTGDDPAPVTRTHHEDPAGTVAHVLRLECEKKKPIRIEKIVAIVTSKDVAISEPAHQARKEIRRAASFEELLDGHARSWSQLWQRCDVAIGDHAEAQAIVRLHIFHLLQTVSLNTLDRDVGVPARGLHGEAYRGHVFWDELFILPFLSLRLPELARQLLMYRCRRLPEACDAARDAGYEGAMFPWQSGSDGREETQELHLNPRSGHWIPDDTHLQRHVNSAIAYNIWKYYQATEDIEFLSFFGAEVILAIARFWATLAEYNPARGRYEIRGVVGPDEYHTRYPDADEPGLSNNAYTNVLAVWVLSRALEVVDLLADDRRKLLLEGMGLDREELARWDQIRRKMFVPFLRDGIISQFEGYETLSEFDWHEYRKRYKDIQRLDRILEAEGDTPNRYKAGKQADVLMLFYLFSADELVAIFDRLGYDFDPQTIPKNIEYYFSRTSHGSTLSRVVHSWVLARSKRKQSWECFRAALGSDVHDIQGGTTAEGVHLGAMAGTVDLVQRCYMGLVIRGDVLWLNPLLPDAIPEVRFRIRYRGHWLRIHCDHARLSITFERGCSRSVEIGVRDKIHSFKQGDQKVFDLRDTPSASDKTASG